jgi:hypothetical protein
VELLKKSTSGVIHVTTIPLGAQVFVDGNLAGTSSPKLELVLPAGEHKVVAQRDGYDEATVPFVLSPGATRDLPVTLDKSIPLTSRWWFWTSVAVVVVGGAVLTYALLSEKKADHGSLQPGQVSAPMFKF